jgi:hypothetical protein
MTSLRNIPVPQQGQPIDYAYISEIVNQLNSLTNSFGSIKTNTKIKEVETKQEPRISTASIAVTNNFAKVGDTYAAPTMTITGFSKPPSVTATFKSSDKTKIKAYAVITDITTTSISVTLIGQETGTIAGTIEVVAIGLPG